MTNNMKPREFNQAITLLRCIRQVPGLNPWFERRFTTPFTHPHHPQVF